MYNYLLEFLNFCLDFLITLLNYNALKNTFRMQNNFLCLFRIQFEIKCKMAADVWVISPYEKAGLMGYPIVVVPNPDRTIKLRGDCMS